MKKEFLFILALLAGASARADSTVNYSSLLGYFGKGTVPQAQEVRGAWSGHCFLERQPTQAFGMILLLGPNAPAGDNGPLFPSAVQGPLSMTITNFEGTRDAENRYDSLDAATRRAVLDLVASPSFARDVVSVRDNSYNSATSNYQIQARKFSAYIIVKFVQGVANGACYFYKKVAAL